MHILKQCMRMCSVPSEAFFTFQTALSIWAQQGSGAMERFLKARKSGIEIEAIKPDNTENIPLQDGASAKGIVRLNMGPIGGEWVMITDPEMYRDMLTDMKNINKNIFYFFAKDYLGSENLLFAGGATWKIARRLTTPAFHVSVLDQFIPCLNSNADIFCDIVTRTPKIEDLYSIIAHALMRSLMETSLGLNITEAKEGTVDEYLHYFEEYVECFSERITSPLFSLDSLLFFTPTARKRARAIDFLHDFAMRAIKERMEYIRAQDNNEDG